MNRIVGNCYIIDSAGLWLTANSASNGVSANFEFISATFVSEGSGALEITIEANTASGSVILIKNHPSTSQTSIPWPGSYCLDDRMFVKTCLAGTGYLFFK